MINPTILNGILIVALVFGLGVHLNDNLLIGAAFVMAGAAYITNVMDECNIVTGRMALFWGTFLLGLATYAYGFLRMIGA